jgi:thioredoxin 1
MKNVKFVKVDVDKNPDLASQYQVFSIPTFVIFKDGAVANQFVGANSREGFEAEIKKVTG